MSARLLDKKVAGRWPFEWVGSAQTDVAKTWAKARKEQRAQQAANEAITAEAQAKVKQLTRSGK